MVSDQTLKLVLGGVLLLHGLGHGGALAALAWIDRFGGSSTGGWLAARSWLLPSLSPSTATTIACAFWIVALGGFVAAALSFWGIALPAGVWRPLAVGAALVSIGGIGLFLGTWPTFNTLAALAVNAGALAAAVWLTWPAEAGVA